MSNGTMQNHKMPSMWWKLYQDKEKEAATVVMQTETNEFEFVAGKLEGDKEYIVKVSVKSSCRDILASGTHSIPLPREEHVPTPQGVRVIAVKKSLRVNWDVSPMHYA